MSALRRPRAGEPRHDLRGGGASAGAATTVRVKEERTLVKDRLLKARETGDGVGAVEKSVSNGYSRSRRESGTHILPVRISRPVSGSGFQKLISLCFRRAQVSTGGRGRGGGRRTHHARTLLVDALDEAQALEDLERARIDAVCLSCGAKYTRGVTGAAEGGRGEEGRGGPGSAAVGCGNSRTSWSVTHRCRALRCACRTRARISHGRCSARGRLLPVVGEGEGCEVSSSSAGLRKGERELSAPCILLALHQ